MASHRKPHPRREEAIELVRSGRTRAEVAIRVGVSQPVVSRWCQQEGIEPVYGTGGWRDSVGDVYLSWLRTTHDPYIRRTWRDTLRQRAGLPPEARRDDEDPSPLSSCLAFDPVPVAQRDPVGDTSCLKCGRRTARTDQPCETRDGQGRLLYVTTTTTCLRRQCGKTVCIARVSAELHEFNPTTKEEQPTMPQGFRTPEHAREELFRRVRAGEHPSEAGRDLGIKESTASDLVRRAGIEYQHRDPIQAAREAKARKTAQKPPSPPPEPRQRSEQSCVRLPDDAVAEAIRLCLDEDHSVRSAAEAVGVNYRSLKAYVTEARKARGLSSPTHPGPRELPPAPSAVTAPEQPPVALRLLTSPDVQAFLRQPSAIQDAIRTYLDQPEAVQLVVRTLISSLKASA